MLEPGGGLVAVLSGTVDAASRGAADLYAPLLPACARPALSRTPSGAASLLIRLHLSLIHI